MAEGKKSFLFYVDWGETFNALDDEQAGKLIKHICSYVNDNDPETDNPIVKAVFPIIQNQLKRDLKKWEDRKEVKSIGGRIGNLKRWNPDLHKKVVDSEMSIDEAEKVAKDRKSSHTDVNRSHTEDKVAVTDTVTVTVTDTVKDNDTSSLPEIKKDIDYIYSLYPTKCPVNGRSITKGRKCKDKIKSLFKSGETKESLEKMIKWFLDTKKKSKSFLSDFHTFLNNLPDLSDMDVVDERVIHDRKEDAKVGEYYRINGLVLKKEKLVF